MGVFNCELCDFTCNKERNFSFHNKSKHQYYFILKKKINKQFKKFKCVISVGIRCHTEIFLKQLGYKKFSGPFDGLYLSSVDDAIYLINNHINYDDLIYTQDDIQFDEYHKQWDFRTIHTKLTNTIINKEKNTHNLFHHCTFPHHNLKKIEVQSHFNRCFDRIDIIENKKIKTLFCLFMHPAHDGYVNVSLEDINRLSDFLNKKFNCHLLAIYFKQVKNNNRYFLIENTNKHTIFGINENIWNYEPVKSELKQIFKLINIEIKNLLTYDYFNH